MRYCVINDTITVLDGSNNDDTVMLKNAENMGFAPETMEILDEATYIARGGIVR